MVPRESNTDWSRNENLMNDLNDNQDSHLSQQVVQLTLKYQKAEIAFNSMHDKYSTLVSEMQEMRRYNETLKQEMRTVINENRTLKIELQRTIQHSQDKIDAMTVVDLNAESLRRDVLTDLKREMKSEIEMHQTELNHSYLRTKLILNYIPVIISLIFVIFTIYYLMTGMH